MYRPAQKLTFNEANAALEAGLRAIENGQTQIDFSDLTQGDSAAVATMLAWSRAAHSKGKSLTFANLPASLCSLIELYGVKELLNTASAPESRQDLPHH